MTLPVDVGRPLPAALQLTAWMTGRPADDDAAQATGAQGVGAAVCMPAAATAGGTWAQGAAASIAGVAGVPAAAAAARVTWEPGAAAAPAGVTWVPADATAGGTWAHGVL